jgi:hypothetical protein
VILLTVEIFGQYNGHRFPVAWAKLFYLFSTMSTGAVNVWGDRLLYVLSPGGPLGQSEKRPMLGTLRDLSGEFSRLIPDRLSEGENINDFKCLLIVNNSRESIWNENGINIFDKVMYMSFIRINLPPEACFQGVHI